MKSMFHLLFWAVVLTGVLALNGCNKKESNNEGIDVTPSLEHIKKKLQSDTLFQKEEPFTVRQFDPYLNDKWIGNAVAYGCYRLGQAPGQKGPSDEQLLEDLQIIARHWNLIRLYGSDEDTKRIVRIINENSLPIRVVLGVWLEPEAESVEKKDGNIEQVLLGIELATKYPQIINSVCVGNETQVYWSGHRMKPANLLRYVRVMRNNVAQPVTTADDYLFWNKQESVDIARELDFVFTHIHPLWNGKSLDQSVEWLDSIYTELRKMHPDREIVIGETGWATDYDSTKTGHDEQGTLITGEVGIKAQTEFLTKIYRWIDDKQVVTFLFEAFDEPWKGGGENSSPNHVEKHWGVFYEDRTPKESFRHIMSVYKKDADNK